MADLGKALVILGAVIVIAGLLLWTGVGGWLGRLPGDLQFRRGNVQVHVPLATCLVISLILSALSWLFFGRR